MIKKICYILNNFPQPSETFVSDEAASFIDIGITPFILAINKGDFDLIQPSARKLLDSNLVTFIYSCTKIQSLCSVFRLFFKRPKMVFYCLLKSLRSQDRWLYFQAAPYAALLLRNKVDFLHAHFADVNLNWAKVLSDWTDIPFGVTTHRYDLLNDPISIDKARRLFMQSHLLVTISEWNKHFMLQKYGIDSDKIRVIHCGVDVDRFKPLDPIKIQGKSRLLNVGRLVPAKGQDILLHALAKVRAECVEFDMVIIGSGDIEDKLMRLSRELQLDDSVKFVGAQSQSYVVNSLKNADIFVLSSISEGLPIVCMEAMSSGVLMIATRINGVPELVQDGVNGFLVEPEDVNGLADAIIWAIRNWEPVGNIRTAAREKIVNDFNREKCTLKLLREMQAVCRREN